MKFCEVFGIRQLDREPDIREQGLMSREAPLPVSRILHPL